MTARPVLLSYDATLSLLGLARPSDPPPGRAVAVGASSGAAATAKGASSGAAVEMSATICSSVAAERSFCGAEEQPAARSRALAANAGMRAR
ncbi:hypothetical protein [Streptomyces sp. 4F14]|uniref:hypothetical protein n=1 Tax=Streptomyces sp. 4F14 TaxID=3394380 RepID=UPI003A8453D5